MTLQLPPLPTTGGQINQGGVLVYQTRADGTFYLTDATNSPTATIGAVLTLTISAGNVIIANIPTSDPHVLGALYANSSVLNISRG